MSRCKVPYNSIMFTFFRSLVGQQRFRSLSFQSDELFRSLQVTTLFIAALLLLHALAMVLFEGMSFGEGVWLSLTTITTVGYGDLSSSTFEGRVATVLLLYFGGIFLLAKLAGDYFEYRASRRARQRCGNWEWNMKDHLLIINAPREDSERFFTRVIEQLRANEQFKDAMVQILTRHYAEGLPPHLSEMEGVAHRNRDALDDNELLSADAEKAAAIIILAREETNPDADSRTFDILHRLREIGVKDIPLIAECVNDSNRSRFLEAGASIVLRPIRSYPEMIVRGLVAPGSEQIIENMFTSESDEYVRFDLPLLNLAWKEVVTALIQHDLGTAVAYERLESREVVTNPHASTIIKASAVFVIVNEGVKASVEHITAALADANNK